MEKKQTAYQILKAARDLLRRNKWCQKELAVDAYGEMTDPTGKEAVAYCAIGAMLAVDGPDPEYNEPGHFLIRAIYQSAKDMRPSRIWNWNDSRTRTKRQVIAAFGRAMKIAQKEQIST
jgi:hypothetical protein